MSRSPPTLADVMIATALDKRYAGGPGPDNVEIRRHLLHVANARKFVLDDSMSRFIWDIEGRLHTVRALENARMLSRLPHSLIFIEFNYQVYFGRAKEEGKVIYTSDRAVDGPVPAKMGWIIGQAPNFENVFVATEITASVNYPDRCLMHPVSIAWTTDNEPLPIETVPLYLNEEDQTYLAMMKGYTCPSVGWVLTYSDSLSSRLAEAYGNDGRKPQMSVRAIVGILSTINDLPVVIEHVEPSRGYVSRGSYKKFLKHSVVRLTVPETRWRKLAAKVAAMVRRRAHQVRGHWRKDWRNPLLVLCVHEYDNEMVCKKCRGRMLWIAEHQRGDASIGFVTHDYAVSKEPVKHRGKKVFHSVDKGLLQSG